MRRTLLAAALGASLALIVAAPLAAQEPPRVTISQPEARLAEQIVVTVEIATPAGATVDIDPGGESWGGVEVVRVVSQTETATSGGTAHRIELLVAPFVPGEVALAPALVVTSDAGAERMVLPATPLSVTGTLAPDAPLELTPLPPPGSVAGAQSPLLVPAIVLGVVAAALLVVLLLTLLGRWLRGLIRRAEASAWEAPAPLEAPSGIATAEALLDEDAIGAYRAIAAAVRRELADRYAFPASALTTEELERRMAAAGVDEWVARMTRELLRECDAVIYAGYRPAAERRRSDLVVAREIVGEGA